MTTCPTCAMMCATTDEQYAHRQTIMAHSDDVHIAPCPRCGSTDWATSKEYIGKEPGKPPERRWWAKSPSWQTIRACQIALSVSLAVSLLFIQEHWLQLFYMFLIGVFVAGAYDSTHMIRITANLDKMSKLFEEMRETNSHLGQALVHMSQHRRDTPPIAPTMN